VKAGTKSPESVLQAWYKGVGDWMPLQVSLVVTCDRIIRSP